MARILYVSQGYSTHDRRFLKKLAESGHETWHLPCTADSGRYEKRPLPEGVHPLTPLSRRPTSPGSLNWIRAALRFRRVIRDVEPEIVHAGPAQTGGFWHIWGHSQEIERYGMWDELTHVLATAAQYVHVGQARCVTNTELVRSHIKSFERVTLRSAPLSDNILPEGKGNAAQAAWSTNGR